MKRVLSLAAVLFAAGAANAAQLACWNLYATKGSAPAFKASFQRNDKLTDVKMLVNEAVFGPFDISDVVTETAGALITTKRSPYYGGQDFTLTPDGDIRIILPADLANDALKATYFNAGNLPDNLLKRQNGVIEVAGSRHNSGGSIFIRMHCVSRE